MNRGTIFIALFVIIAAGIIAIGEIIEGQPPLEVVVVADPLLEDWLRDVVTDFNGSEQRLMDGRSIHVTLQFEGDLQVWRDRRWTSTNHPDGWIAASSVSFRYAQEASLPLQIVVDSVAQTPLIFGAFESRANVLSDTPIDWEDVQRIAEAESWQSVGGEASWRFVNLAFALPDERIAGLGTLLSGIAAFTDTATLSGTQLQSRDVRDWLEPVIQSVPSNNVGVDAASFMARSGAGAVDIAIATESQWLTNLSGLTRGEAFELSYPEYLVVFDFPVSVWEDTSTTNDKREAVSIFANWLTSDAQQAELTTYGLRPVDGIVPPTDALFSQGEAYGIQLDLTGAQRVEFPSRSSDIQSLLTWFDSNRR